MCLYDIFKEVMSCSLRSLRSLLTEERSNGKSNTPKCGDLERDKSKRKVGGMRSDTV